jgi:hypothetical protein
MADEETGRQRPKCKALLALAPDRTGVVLQYRGRALTDVIEDSESYDAVVHELNENAPLGLSVWEGWYPTDEESAPEGEHRQLTHEEWERLEATGRLWTDNGGTQRERLLQALNGLAVIVERMPWQQFVEGGLEVLGEAQNGPPCGFADGSLADGGTWTAARDALDQAKQVTRLLEQALRRLRG